MVVALLRSKMTLPFFLYHPDPISTGMIVVSDNSCVCCSLARGFIYCGPVYAVEEYDSCICPWCIVDGSAHSKLGVSFTDETGVGNYGVWAQVSSSIVEEVAYRTPGFIGWQQERWWTHCNDAAAFIGRAGSKDLLAIGPQMIASIQSDAGLGDGPEWDHFFAALDKDGSPTAYVFKCLSCGQFGGYQDCD
jgi:uncharacterized protein